jgi:hypothetical protein
VEQVENRILGIEDKLEELEKSFKDHAKMLKKMNGTCKTSETPSKDQLYKSWI